VGECSNKTSNHLHQFPVSNGKMCSLLVPVKFANWTHHCRHQCIRHVLYRRIFTVLFNTGWWLSKCCVLNGECNAICPYLHFQKNCDMIKSNGNSYCPFKRCRTNAKVKAEGNFGKSKCCFSYPWCALSAVSYIHHSSLIHQVAFLTW